MDNKYMALQSELDERDIVYGNIEFVGATPKLPSKFRLQETPLRDQGWLGSCVGQAIAAIMECDGMVRFGEDVGHLSPLFVYANAKAKDGSKGQGTSPRVAMEELKSKGICREELYPYIDDNNTKNNIFPKISSEVIEEAKLRRPTGYARVTRLEDIKKAVYCENGCMLIIRVFSNVDDTHNGFMKPPKGSYMGNHAMSIVGYDDDLEQVIDGKIYKGFLLIRDSYGDKEKGRDKGYFYLAYDGLGWKNVYDVDKLVTECWTTFDTSKVKNLTYHTDRFDGNAITPTKKEIKMQLGSKLAYVNGVKKEMLTVPTVRNGATFVPIRFVAESLDARVSYAKEEKQIYIYDDNQKLSISMWVSNKTAKVKDKEYIMIEAPFIENGSTLVPIRACAEMLNYKVDFNPKTKEITIRG